MSLNSIKAEARDLLAETNFRFREAHRSLRGGTSEERVRAAGRLVRLRRSKEAFEARVAELDRASDTVLSGLVQRVREEWTLILLHLDGWPEQ
jgi:hypothetical protein